MTITTSDVSRASLLPDAGIGSVAYMIEMLMVAIGDKQRWSTMPWTVLMFAMLVVPLRNQHLLHYHPADLCVTPSRTLLMSVLIGAWLMLTRLTFGSTGAMANSDQLVGALVKTFSVIAWADVARPVRFISVAFGASVIVAPWLHVGKTSVPPIINALACGLALILLAMPKGKVRNRYAGVDRFIT